MTRQQSTWNLYAEAIRDGRESDAARHWKEHIAAFDALFATPEWRRKLAAEDRQVAEAEALSDRSPK